MEKIRIGIMGYGNLGKGAHLAAAQNPDMTVAGIFTRRDPSAVAPVLPAPVYAEREAERLRGDIDVLLLCGGSATDLPEQGPRYAALFNTVDSFDTHADIPAYFEAVDKAAKAGGNAALISVGWDPGLFSLNRAYAQSVLPDGADYTFWGRGVSQGHSDAARRVPGVLDARQYTVPVESAVEAVRRGETPALNTRQKHTRLCYVVAEPGADKARIEREIKEMPKYYAEYDTTVVFITAEEMARDHSGLPHGGFVIRSGRTGAQRENGHVIEYSLNLGSNPEFTGSVPVAYARAAYRLAKSGAAGAHTVLDVAPALLSPKSGEELRRELL